MTETVLFILEIIGTAVFAASGALAGLQRQLDAFGVVILGVCTACGGGVIRDLTLGITPPVMFCQPVYALVAMGVPMAAHSPAMPSRSPRACRSDSGCRLRPASAPPARPPTLSTA